MRIRNYIDTHSLGLRKLKISLPHVRYLKYFLWLYHITHIVKKIKDK